METNPSAESNPSPSSPASTDPTNAILIGQARHALSCLAGIGVAHGCFSSSSGEALSSILLLALVMFWSAWQKSAAAKKYSAEFSQALAEALSVVDQTQSTPTPQASPVAAATGGATPFLAVYPQSPKQTAPAAANGAAAGFAGLRVLACLAILSLAMSGCATVSKFVASPTTTSVLNAVLNGALDYASGNDAGVAIVGIDEASLLLRQLQATPNAANPAAVKSAVKSGGAATIASTVANAITTLTKAGATPDAANETVAEQLDQAVEQVTPTVPDAVPSAMTRGERDTLIRDQALFDANARLKRKMSRCIGIASYSMPYPGIPARIATRSVAGGIYYLIPPPVQIDPRSCESPISGLRFHEAPELQPDQLPAPLDKDAITKPLLHFARGETIVPFTFFASR